MLDAELSATRGRTRRNLIKIGARVAGAATASALFGVLGATRSEAHRERHQHAERHGDRRAQCFLRGTNIRTADGDRRVEELAIGDLLPTMFGGLRPIQWIGRYVYKKSDPTRPWVKDVRPVRVARSAFAPNVPARDLYLTRGHALCIDGLLVPSGNLVNDVTITLHPAEEMAELEFFHIKLETHDVIFAEDAPCESLREVTEGAQNFAEYFRLYGEPDRHESSCVPLVPLMSGVSEIRSRLRSALSPWIDLRSKADVIRDMIEEGALVVAGGEV
jgi:hypothetical protein